MRHLFERRFNPVSALTFALLLGFLCVPLMGAVTWNMYESLSRIATNEMGLQRLIGTISHLSEFLGMSAQMAAATEDPGWERRYRGKEGDLDQALADVAVLAREEYHKNYAAQTKMVARGADALEAILARHLVIQHAMRRLPRGVLRIGECIKIDDRSAQRRRHMDRSRVVGQEHGRH